MRSRLCFVTISLSFAPDRGAWALSAFGANLNDLREICQKKYNEISFFVLSVSWRFFPRNFPKNQPIYPLREFAPVNPARFSFFLRDLSEALLPCEQRLLRSSLPRSVSNGCKQCSAGYNYDRDVLVEKYVEQKMSKN